MPNKCEALNNKCLKYHQVSAKFQKYFSALVNSLMRYLQKQAKHLTKLITDIGKSKHNKVTHFSVRPQKVDNYVNDNELSRRVVAVVYKVKSVVIAVSHCDLLVI